MARANAMGLTDGQDLSKSVRDRFDHAVRVARGEAPGRGAAADDDAVEAEADWADIHVADDEFGASADFEEDDDDSETPEPFELRDLREATLDDDLLDVVEVLNRDEWALIEDAAFEVDTQVIDDRVMKGRWTVKNGKSSFKPWRFWPASTEDEQLSRAAEMERVRRALAGDVDEDGDGEGVDEEVSL